MRTLLIATLTAVALFSSRADEREVVINQLVERIRSEFPEGWTVRFEKETSWLEIERSNPILIHKEAYPSMPAPIPGESDLELKEFSFGFGVAPYMDISTYQRLKIENRAAKEEMAALAAILAKKNIVRGKGWDFIGAPQEPEDRERIAKYIRLEKSIHVLPEFYYHDLSLNWGPRTTQPEKNINDPIVAEECRKVRERVIALLSRYEESDKD